jgi:hypothetical protein
MPAEGVEARGVSEIGRREGRQAQHVAQADEAIFEGNADDAVGLGLQALVELPLQLAALGDVGVDVDGGG